MASSALGLPYNPQARIRKGDDEALIRSNIAFANVWTVNLPDVKTGVIGGWDKRESVISVLQVARHTFNIMNVHSFPLIPTFIPTFALRTTQTLTLTTITNPIHAHILTELNVYVCTTLPGGP